MKIRSHLFLVLLFASVLLSEGTYAQSSILWKKRVVRTLELDEHLMASPQDSNLYMYLCKNVFSRKLKAYYTGVAPLQEEFDITMEERASQCDDTMIIIDPVTEEEKAVVRKKNPDFDSIRSYRVLEDWEYDPVSGKASIQLIAIGPIRRVYGDDGIYRGTQTICWLRYHDAVKEFRSYEQKKHIPVTKRIWQDYVPVDTSRRLIVSVIDITAGDRYSEGRYGESLYWRKAAGEMIFGDIEAGQLKAYSITDPGLRKSLSPDQIKRILAPVHFKEEHAGSCYLPPRTAYFDPEKIARYQVLENWTANQDSGKVEIKVVGVAPIEDASFARSEQYKNKPLFWVRYADLDRVIRQYDQYHPENTLALNIWNNFFQRPKCE